MSQYCFIEYKTIIDDRTRVYCLQDIKIFRTSCLQATTPIDEELFFDILVVGKSHFGDQRETYWIPEEYIHRIIGLEYGTEIDRDHSSIVWSDGTKNQCRPIVSGEKSAKISSVQQLLQMLAEKCITL